MSTQDTNIANFTQISLYYSNDLIPWATLIGEKFGPLYGYKSDLDKKGIDIVLKDLLLDSKFTLYEGDLEVNNLNLISNAYEFHLNTLKPENIEENSSDITQIDQEIAQLKSSTINSLQIIKKYGILPGIVLQIPIARLQKDYSVIMGENAFIKEKLESLYNKTWEDKQHNYLYEPENYGAEKAQIVTVFIFSRTEGKIIDITESLSQITTNVTKTGGNFTLRYNLNYDLNTSYYGKSTNYVFDNSITSKDYFRAAHIQNLFRENDLVFIKFETLKVELTGIKNIAGQVWDMIGLIDQTSISTEPIDLQINISGRDLSKLLIEDQNIFIPYQFANSKKTTFGGDSSKIFKRLFATGEYKLQFIYSMRSIQFTMGFIYNHLTNMEILSDEGKLWLKTEYGEKLAKEFIINKSGITEGVKSIDGIWGLVKLQIDEKIQHYRIADASISSPDGSIMNQFQKLAQEPFVELQFDTFGDFYNIIARKPPWDAKSIKEATCITIHEGNAIADSFTFDRDIYTIFQIDPQGALFGGNNSLPLAYIPMVVLDEYVKIWGNKFFKGTTNYIDYNTYFRQIDGNQKNSKEGFIDDLCWLIETMAYKPFTRIGTITLKGDRRIKRGMWIYYKKTQEIFYVDAVQNSAQIGSGGQIERITTLNVSRGMIRDMTPKKDKFSKNPIVGKEFTTVEIVTDFKDSSSPVPGMDLLRRDSASYFNLIDLDFLRESLKRNLINIKDAYTLSKSIQSKGETTKNIETKSIVNSGIFNFFLKGLQFAYKPTLVDLKDVDIFNTIDYLKETIE